MKIEEYEIKKWTEGFNDIRRILQTSPDFVCWCIPTKRILNLLPPILNGFFLCTYIDKYEGRDKPTFNLVYAKRSGNRDMLESARIGFCCDREDNENTEKTFVDLAKTTKQAFYIKASRKLAKVFIDNVYNPENRPVQTGPVRPNIPVNHPLPGDTGRV